MMDIKKTLNKVIEAINIKSDIFSNISEEINKIRNIAREIPNTIINPVTADNFYPLCVSNLEIIKSLMKNNPIGLSKLQNSKQDVPLHTIEEQVYQYIKEHSINSIDKTLEKSQSSQEIEKGKSQPNI